MRTASPGYSIICDPGPCDPGALITVARDFGLWILLIFVATAFMAGRKVTVTNFVLPVFCMSVIAAAFYLNFYQKILRVGDSLRPHGEHLATDLRVLEMTRQETAQFYAMGYLAFAIAPFLLGGLIAFISQRKLKRSHA